MTMLTQDLLASLDASIADVSKAATLPAELYTSAEFLDFEADAVFTKEWVCVGRAERIPEVGDWFTTTIVGEPLIIARDKQGEVRAMSAVCQHRAMQVCEGQGNDTTFKCPYHHWNYAPRRSAARCAGYGTHRGLLQVRLGAATAAASSSGWVSYSSTSTTTPRR